MIRDFFLKSKKRVIKLLNQEPQGETGNLFHVVENIMQKKSKILEIVKKYKTPFYIIDDEELHKSIYTFFNTFKKYIPNCKIFYAMKSNHHPHLLKSVVKAGLGIDVSSGRELSLALKHKPKSMLFTGPGKTTEELKIALEHNEIVTINMDSFGELKRLGELTNKLKKKIRVGVRIVTQHQRPWTKFGIPISELKQFFNQTKQYKYLNFEGIHFHISENRNAIKYKKTIEELANYLKDNFSLTELKKIKFIDLGGGFFPDKTEGYFPWVNHSSWAINQATFMKLADNHLGTTTTFPVKYYITSSLSLENFAKEIASAIKKYLNPILQCNYYFEPGRIISTKSMHLVLKIMDVKNSSTAITDGGLNLIGWEFGKQFYLPIINMINFSKEEIPYTLYGSLCTPRDIWGLYCYAKKVEENDIIVIPNQGAYRFALAQSFIKDLPKVYIMK